jgi:hypothetical protein
MGVDEAIGLMSSGMVALALAAAESVTVNIGLVLLAPAGVPVIAPEELTLNPSGKEEPVERLQVYGGIPPVAAKVVL